MLFIFYIICTCPKHASLTLSPNYSTHTFPLIYTFINILQYIFSLDRSLSAALLGEGCAHQAVTRSENQTINRQNK